VPIPIQSGSITTRLRNFFRIRGKTAFALDEIVAPVVLVQDLTVGPYQAGVSPCAGQITFQPDEAVTSSLVILLNDKPGSITPVLDKQFDGRSFSFTFIEMQNVGEPTIVEWTAISIRLIPREVVVAMGVPDGSQVLSLIQNNPGTIDVPVEIYTFNSAVPGSPQRRIWRGVLGDNINTLGSRRTIEPTPNITIGPGDALALTQDTTATPTTGRAMRFHARGFYQEQPS